MNPIHNVCDFSVARERGREWKSEGKQKAEDDNEGRELVSG
jgi:hypothetical protein